MYGLQITRVRGLKRSASAWLREDDEFDARQKSRHS